MEGSKEYIKLEKGDRILGQSSGQDDGKNALSSPELKDWLLNFTVTYMDIGYTEGEIAVFDAKLPQEKTQDFPFYEEGNMDRETFIDRQIVLLQGDIVEFEFSNYLESNPILSVLKLIKVFRQVYPNVEQGEGA